MAKVMMPQLGESVAEGTIGKWLKQPGDFVARNEPLLEVVTDKVNAEVPSPFEGILTEILVQEGDVVPNNAEIAVIDERSAVGSAAPAAESPAAKSPAAESPAAAPTAGPAPAGGASAGGASAVPRQPEGQADSPPRAVATSAAAEPAAVRAAPAAAAGVADARLSPAVRRLLRENGVSNDQIRGTGGTGRITRDDVKAFLAGVRSGGQAGGNAAVGSGTRAAPAAGPAVSIGPGHDDQLIPWTRMRRGIATAMAHSTSTVPHASTTLEVDATNLVRLRLANKEAFRAREGSNLSYVPFMVKAVVEALRRHPQVNAHWTEAGLLVKRRINVGIAVAVDEGLIVPVIYDADQLSISGLNRAILDVAERARSNRLRLDDLQGGTITVNNTGSFGSTVSGSIINTPEIAIVNLEGIIKRPVVLETAEGEVIAIRSMINVPVVFDHRATDGAQIGRFAGDIKAWIEAIGPETPIY